MKFILEIKEEAINDIKEAYIYYEENRIGLGERFIVTLDFYFNRITEYPENYQQRKKPYREAFIKDFPFLIIYEITDNKIIVYAVFNTSKNPKKKFKKSK